MANKKNIFVFHGSEHYLIDQAVRELKAKVLEPGWEAFGYDLLEDKTATVDNIVNSVQTFPAFAPCRFVLIRNPIFLKAEENTQEQMLMDAFGNIPDGVTVVIAIYGSLDMRKKFSKFLQANAVIEKFESFESWDRHDVVTWIQNNIATQGYKINEEAASFLAEVSGHSLGALANELAKIITYCGNNKSITREVVATVASQGEQSLFEISEAFRQRDISRLLVCLRRLWKDGEQPQSVLGFLAAQVKLLLQIKELQQLGKNYQGIAQLVKKNPFYIKNIMEKDAAKYALPDLKKFYYGLQQADFNSKTGIMPADIALEMAVATLLS